MSKEQWQRYAQIWSSDAATHEREMAVCLTADVTYRDPLTVLSGHEDFSKYMADFQGNFPGCRFKIKEARTHHGRSLATWDLVDAQGGVVMPGMSYALLADDGKFSEFNGFFDPPA